MLVPNRHASSNSYRYGFQGQEKDEEIKGEGNSLNYTFRMHDPRVGRFFAVDPLAYTYPHNSPYAFSENVVINSIELEGLEQYFVVDKGKVSPATPEQYRNKSLKKFTSEKLALEALEKVKLILNFNSLIQSAKENTYKFHERQRSLSPIEKILENPNLVNEEKELANSVFPAQNQNLGIKLVGGIGGYNLSQELIDLDLLNKDLGNDNIESNGKNIIFSIKVLEQRDTRDEILFVGGGVLETRMLVIAKLASEDKPREFHVVETITEASFFFLSLDAREVKVDGKAVIRQKREGLSVAFGLKRFNLFKLLKNSVEIQGDVKFDAKTDFNDIQIKN